MLQYSIPYYWGNEGYMQKIEQCSFEENNSVFIGNSKLFHHVIPTLFDSLTIDNTKSVNMGTDGMNIFELQYLLQGYVKNNQDKNIFVLCNAAYTGLSEENKHSSRMVYFWTLMGVKDAIVYMKEDIAQVKNHLRNYVTNLLLLGKGVDLINEWVFRNKPVNKKICTQKGYYSMDDQYPNRVGELKRKHQRFIKGLSRGKTRNLKKNIKRLKFTEQDLLIKQQYDNMMELVEASNNKLYFIFLPNSKLYYLTKYENAIYLGDGVDFPAYFLPKYWFDNGHLNHQGAILLTKKFANMYNKLNSE